MIRNRRGDERTSRARPHRYRARRPDRLRRLPPCAHAHRSRAARVETSVREAFSMDLDTVVVRECCWGADAKAHAYSLDTSMKMYARIRTLEQTLAMLA